SSTTFPLLSSSILRSYRNGFLVSQSLRLVIFKTAFPDACTCSSATFVDPSQADILTVWPLPPATVGITSTVFVSISGVILMPSTYAAFTASSYTVCQIPVTGVYQMPCGFTICLPLGCGPLSVGSQTFRETV